VFLFLAFHVGEGVFRTTALGLSRLTWLNFHRLPALIAAAGIGLHVALNWKAFVARLWHGFYRERTKRAASELMLYVAFGTVAMTGIVVWLFVKGSAPLAGPAPLGHLPHLRHQFVDVHNIAGLVTLALTAHHVGHRWHRMVRCLGELARSISTWTPVEDKEI
jgi:hypothetical protein